MTHRCISKLTIIGSDNGLSPRQCQAIIWTNAGMLLIGPLGTNFSEILIEIHTLQIKKMHLKMSSGKWRPFCLKETGQYHDCWWPCSLCCQVISWHGINYPQTSNIWRTLVGNRFAHHSDVVGAAPVGAVPTTSSFLTEHLASMDWAKTSARPRRDAKHLSFWIWCTLH